VFERGGVRRVHYGPGEQGAEVEFITIAEAGHVWPGGPRILAERIAGKRTRKLNATDAIWEFFERHPRL
jgi:polyhydroxybutyrate depolymerase